MTLAPAAALDQAAIRRLIPHTGAMCLLDAVIAWDERGIHCRATRHCEHGHPLARDGRLAAIHLIEYGAQAMAVHGGLAAAKGDASKEARPAPGLLVAARDVRIEVDRIDGIATPLEIHAERLVAGGGGWLYRFHVESAGRPLAAGRVSVLPAPGDNLSSP